MSAILDQFGRPISAKAPSFGRVVKHLPPHLAARYEAARQDLNNASHWKYADLLSPDASANALDRATIRSRARYECSENNSLAKGVILTLAMDMVGPAGPRLQVRSQDQEFNRFIEAEFSKWSVAVRLAEKLRGMRCAKAIDGEAFATFVSNSRNRHPISLDVIPFEADLCTSIDQKRTEYSVDGIRFDSLWNPVEYDILKQHPGADFQTYSANDVQKYDADDVIHWFRADRPGQHRGVSEIASALRLFADYRRYVNAVVSNAELAASITAIMFTDAPSIEPEPDSGFESFDIETQQMMTLPSGWKIQQLRAEQPHTAFAEFRRAIINEVARCVLMPYNIAAGDSSRHNYSSGRLDHQTYDRSLQVEQFDARSSVLDRIVFKWLEEAMIVWPDRFSGVPPFADIPFEFIWQRRGHVDPQKEAVAQREELDSRTTSLKRVYAAKGLDWEEELEQIAAEKQALAKLGLGSSESAPPAASANASLDLQSMIEEAVSNALQREQSWSN